MEQSGTTRLDTKKRNLVKGDITLAPMADVAFLLLIFFLSTAVFLFEEGVPVLLPSKGLIPVQLKKPVMIRVEIGRDGRIFLEGEEVALSDLSGRGRMILQKDKDTLFSIETHGLAPYGMMVSCLGALRDAGANRVSLRELPG